MKTSSKSYHQAIALQDEESALPRVIAKGDDELAQRIISIADEHGIPVRKEPAVLELLADVPLGDEIPDVLYEVVSEIMSFTFMLKTAVETEGE